MKKNILIIIFLFLTLIPVVHAKNINIILIGLPGAGKGTVSQYLVEKYNYYHICPGDLFRKEVRQGTKFGNKIKRILEKAEYVKDDEAFAFLNSHMNVATNKNQPMLFDGYPRSMEAKYLLESYLIEHNMIGDTLAIVLQAPSDVLKKRVLGRVVCNSCNHVYSLSDLGHNKSGHKCKKCGVALQARAQDTKELFDKRVKHYNEIMLPLLESLRDNIKVVIVNTNKNSDDVIKEVEDNINLYS